MKMKSIGWVAFFFLLHFAVHAQTIITGRVTDSQNHPIPYATVYLSKTTMGVLANQNGVYSLNVSQTGTYELIVSCVGYESHSQIINANGADKRIDISLSERTVLIKEVTIKGKDVNREFNYNKFVGCFIGRTENAAFCKIKNPKDLIIYRSSNDSNLIAYSIKPLEIENSSLGYKIIYDLQYFNYNRKTGHLRFSGDYYFQDITNKDRANLKIQRRRLISYYGSRMHFLRALFVDSVSQENFKIYNTQMDSTHNSWVKSDIISDKEVCMTLKADSMTIYHPNPIVINYSDNHPELFPLPQVYRPGEYNSLIVFNDSLHVYRNGYYPDGYDLSWGGFMSRDRIAELLPYDFVPKSVVKSGTLFQK